MEVKIDIKEIGQVLYDGLDIPELMASIKQLKDVDAWPFNEDGDQYVGVKAEVQHNWDVVTTFLKEIARVLQAHRQRAEPQQPAEAQDRRRPARPGDPPAVLGGTVRRPADRHGDQDGRCPDEPDQLGDGRGRGSAEDGDQGRRSGALPGVVQPRPGVQSPAPGGAARGAVRGGAAP